MSSCISWTNVRHAASPAVTADGPSVAVLAHGLGGVHGHAGAGWLYVGRCRVGADLFALVAFAWRRPRFDPRKPGRPLPQVITRLVDSRVLRTTVAGLALLFTAWVVMAGLFGPQTPTNALPQAFYVLLWVELVAVSLLVGPVWRVLSPGILKPYGCASCTAARLAWASRTPPAASTRSAAWRGAVNPAPRQLSETDI